MLWEGAQAGGSPFIVRTNLKANSEIGANERLSVASDPWSIHAMIADLPFRHKDLQSNTARWATTMQYSCVYLRTAGLPSEPV